MKPKFKDTCDQCGKFDYCKGVNGKVLCQDCQHKEENNNGKND